MKKILFGFILSLIASTASFAQPGPGPGPVPSPWVVTGSSIYYTKGPVGVGTSAPNSANAETIGSAGINGSLSSEVGVTAAGTTQGTAQALAAPYWVHVVSTVSSGTGVELPPIVSGRSDIIVNAGANPLKIYPVTGGQIDGLGTNQPLTLNVGAKVSFNDSSSTQIYSGVAPNIAAGTNVTLSASGGVTTINVPAAGSTGNVQINAGSGVFGAGATPGSVLPKNLGTSVNDPGTGTLEALIPAEATTTGNSKVFSCSDMWKRARRSNSGTAMTDTFPASSASCLANGSEIYVSNADTTASDTITAGSGTVFSGGSTVVVGPGRGVLFTYDTTGGTPTWRANNNDLTTLVSPIGGSNTTYYVPTASVSALVGYGTNSPNVAHANVTAYYANGFVGGGYFNWTLPANAPGGGCTPNGGTVFAATGVSTSVGCWVREVSGPIDNLMFGASANGTTNDSATVIPTIDAAIAYHTYAHLVPNSAIDNVTVTSSENGGTMFLDNVIHLASSTGAMLTLNGVQNVTIYGIVNGNRANQPQNEFVHSLQILGGSDISVPYWDCYETRGDCEYMARDGSGNVPTHITQGPLSCYNTSTDGRNALSVISVNGLSVSGFHSHNCGGTVNSVAEPGGLDLEPNASADTISNVVITGIDGDCTNCTDGVSIGGVRSGAYSYNISNVSLSGRFQCLGTGQYCGRFLEANNVRLDLDMTGDPAVNTRQGPTVDDVNGLTGSLSATNFVNGILIGTSSTDGVENGSVNIHIQSYGALSGPSSVGLATKNVSRMSFFGQISDPASPTSRQPFNAVHFLNGSTMSDDSFDVSAYYNGTYPSDGYNIGTGTFSGVYIQGANLASFVAGPGFAVNGQVAGIAVSGLNFINPYIATASSGAVTCNFNNCVITTDSLSTAAGATYTLTITNPQIVANSGLQITLTSGTNTTVGAQIVAQPTITAGQAVVVIKNTNASSALNGTLKLSVTVI